MRKTARAIVVSEDNLLLMYRNKFGYEYFSLIGGEIEIDESPEETAIREVSEESSLVVDSPRLVMIENAGKMFGVQYIYLCQYVSGSPVLRPDSIEAQISQKGDNIYKPVWVKLAELDNINLLPSILKESIIKYLDSGFPDSVVEISTTD